ncbi:hypothetical protein C723_1457 [Christiangramia flava JLT2011]|uniref:Uncharacterized protein n=1 Tax=Christiangramia flava JLT2011 TaxID=1229726 RepID=A0A1L7I919_9FLAO|nr:hypothetical protein GRFL_3346 [Christiangramia flava JLT2011]OSS39555.1 hypothetical protein C723_1457 [Christiangramia flava JLT2011]
MQIMALQSYKTTIKKPPEMNPEGFYSKNFLSASSVVSA